MFGRILTIAKYEVRQYRKSYFEQFFVFAGILLIFFMVGGVKGGGTLDTPSSYGMYRIGFLPGGGLEGTSHYSLRMTPYTDRAKALEGLGGGAIDVYAEASDGLVTFKTSGSVKSQAALKRLKQVILGAKRDRIYQLADANASLDGILLPIKVRTAEYAVDYDNAVDPSVYTHRSRLINRGATDNGEAGSRVNILDYADVQRMNVTQYLMMQGAANDSMVDESGFTLPEEWEIPFVLKSIYDNMAVMSVSILLSILLMLSLAREKVKDTIFTLFQTPSSKVDILAGKSLPYFGLMLLVNLAYSLTVSAGFEALKVFAIFTVLSATLSTFALFTVLASKNYREVTFMGSISLFSFLLFIVFPNVFSGINILSFVSPLDTVTSIQNGGSVGFTDVLLSLTPYVFLGLFLFVSTVVCFDPETFQNTPGLIGLLKLYYMRLSRSLGEVQYAVVAVSLLVPLVFMVQTLSAYLIIPMGYLAPTMSVLLLAALEELAKILPYYYHPRIRPLKYGLVAGATFFVTEKVFNIYLISKVYSYLPAPYTVFVVKGFMYTLVLHIVATSFYALVVSRFRGRAGLYVGLVFSAVIHYAYNLYMMGGGMFR